VRRPFYRRVWFWVVFTIVLLLALTAAWAALLVPRVLQVRDVLTQAVPLALEAKQKLLAGDRAGVAETTAQLAELSAEAREQSDSPAWSAAEWVPVMGKNLSAVRLAADSVDSIVTDVVEPLSTIDISSLKQSGGVNVAALQQAAPLVQAAAETTDRVSNEIGAIDVEALLPQVKEGVTKLRGANDELRAILDPANTALKVLPGALGADGERSYLLLFQNNAESRGSGGNPAAIMRVTFTDGHISIAEQASSGDFNNERAEPIVPLDDATIALFDTKIARYMQDMTLTPDFTETATIAQAFWAETFGTPVDGVISFDPVALSYLLSATGPIQLPTGEVIDANNAVPMLLSEVYSKYTEPEEQDAFFAGAAGMVFDALVSGDGDMRSLMDPLGKALNEGRLLLSLNDPALEDLIAGTRLSGTLPSDNAKNTNMAVYVNDVTEGKLDYYLQLDIAATSSQCTVPQDAQFSVTATLTNTLTPEQAADLPRYVAPARFFAKGDISTDLVVYGPVGSSFESMMLDGVSVDPEVNVEHLGRPAVRFNVLNQPSIAHSLTVNFTGAAGDLGPLEVRHTPMVRPSNIELSPCS